VAWLTIAVVSLIAAIVLSIAVADKIAIPFDDPILAFAKTFGGLKLLWEVLSEIGNYPMIPLGLGLVAWLWWKKRHRESVFVLLILIVATIADEGIKAIAARPRPEGPVPGIPGVVYSYPSGHVHEDVMILGMYSVRLWESAKPYLLRIGFALVSAVLCLLIGFARLALDVHFPSDVLGGLLGGLACLGWYAWGTRRGAWAAKPGASLSGLHLWRKT
jgi:undecaprenyl-diphosphatase